MSLLPAGRPLVHRVHGHWLRTGCLVGALLIAGCASNSGYIALEDLPGGRTSDDQATAPSSGSREQPPQRRQAAPTSPSGRESAAEDLPAVYTVEKGDTLYSIAFRYSRDFRNLAAANGIDPPYLIVPGQKINTRATSPSSSSTQTPKTSSSPPSTSGSGSSSSSPANSAESTTDPPSARPPGRWIWPVRGDIVREFSEGPSGSKGLDIGANAGTPIQAAAAGTVVYAGDGLRGYGNLIILEHSGQMLSAYAFTEQITVAEQDSVSQGETIAQVGTRGETALLHFEIRSEGKPVDPMRHLP